MGDHGKSHSQYGLVAKKVLFPAESQFFLQKSLIPTLLVLLGCKLSCLDPRQQQSSRLVATAA